MKKVYGYTRVSTVKQGEGVSLVEQKESIKKYANLNNLKIIDWYEEKETAAKQGRPVFSKMISLLNKRKVDGVIIHKIDRSARNLKDWAELGELMDRGIEVHFSFEAIDFNTRGGRLSADIQAVIASDYIRNLSDESKKGLYGRLKQGIYPFQAPIGYLDSGGGNLKTVDPEKAPLIKKLFQFYATGLYSIIDLTDKMYEIGLRNRNGKKVTRNGISTILHNPFYVGTIKLRKNGQVFEGKHKPLVSKSLFIEVQNMLDGKKKCGKTRHDYLYSRRIKCELCLKSLIAEKQKGRVYYRCHTKGCLIKTIREDVIDEIIADFLGNLSINQKEFEQIKSYFDSKRNKNFKVEDEIKLLKFDLAKDNHRLERMTEKFIDGLLDDDMYALNKERILLKIGESKEKIEGLKKSDDFKKESFKFLELLKSLKNIYFNAKNERKRIILKILTSNLVYSPEKLSISTHNVLSGLVNPNSAYHCGDYRAHSRTSKGTRTFTVDYSVTKTKERYKISRISKLSTNKKQYYEYISRYPIQCHEVMRQFKALNEYGFNNHDFKN